MASVKVPIKVQKRSGFDKSHHNALSQFVGTITPLLVDEVIPNSKVYLRFAMAGSLPPLAVDTYMKTYYDVRAFFVPFRLLWGGAESWFTNYPYNVVTLSGGVNAIDQRQAVMPSLSIAYDADLTGMFGRGTLSDYLGFKFNDNNLSVFDEDIELSLLPYLAYHRVCDDWFRQPNITVSCFARPADGSSPLIGPSYGYCAAMAPFISPTVASSVFSVPSGDDINSPVLLLADNVSVMSLRQANYDYDYFTNALPSPQLGNPLNVSTSGGSFTIASLRAANSLQVFAEMNALSGSNMVDVVKQRYGANLHHGVAQRCIYLGGARIDIASKTVEVTAAANISTNNPFRTQAGSTAGRAIVQGSDLIIDDFVAEEPGYIFVVGTIIPKVNYGSGIRRYLRHYLGTGSITDMANPILQNIGNQPIYTYELDSSLGINSENGQIFGYTDRYAEFMTMEDETHGLLSIGGNLQSFVAQRDWNPGDRPVIGTNFLTVPTSSLNNITAVPAQIAQFGFYGQFAFEYKVSQPLAQYSLPSLQNPAYEHGKTVMVHRGGFRF